MLHHYTQFIEQEYIADADAKIAQLLLDYESLNTNQYVYRPSSSAGSVFPEDTRWT